MIVSLAVFLFCAVFLLSGCDKEPTWQEFYDAGIQASEEENYEEAIVAFEEAIALDASHPEAYAALADVYLAKEDLEQALEVLQRGVEATNDETLKARVEEITVKLEELAGPQKPEYMVEYLGMTVNEIAALWGEDYTVAPDLYLGGSKGIYYEDGRLPATFYFQDIFNNGVQTGKERIDLIEISSDLTIAEGFFPALTRPELESTHPEGEFAFFEESGNGATYTCKYNDNISIIYGWEYGADPEITPAPWITLYMEGLDVRLDVAHGVVDGGESRERATRRVDVNGDLPLRVHRLETQQLGHHRVGDVVADRSTEEDDPVLEQLRVRVDATHAVAGAFLPLGDVVVAGHLFGASELIWDARS